MYFELAKELLCFLLRSIFITCSMISYIKRIDALAGY